MPVEALGITRLPADRRAAAAAIGRRFRSLGMLTLYGLVRRRRIVPNPRRPADNSASVDGSGTPTGPSTALDCALTAKATGPTTPGNVTEKPAGVSSCKVPSSTKLVTPAGKFPGGGDIPVSESDWNVARNPTVAPSSRQKAV